MAAVGNDRWCTFVEILGRLHQEGILIHSEQLAEFMLFHGLPVDLKYVPARLQQRAKQVNQYYQGDMAQLATLSSSETEFVLEPAIFD